MLLDFFRNSTLSLLFAFTCIICFTILLSGLQIDHLKCHPNAKLNCKIIQNNSMLYATVNSIVYQKGKFYFVVDDQKLLYCFRFEIKWGGLFITILLYRHILDSGIHMLSATFLVQYKVIKWKLYVTPKKFPDKGVFPFENGVKNGFFP